MTDPVSLNRRREFLQASAVAGVAASTLTVSSPGVRLGHRANERLNIAVIGVGTRGAQLLTPSGRVVQERHAQRQGDADRRALHQAARPGARQGRRKLDGKAEGARDYRQILDDKNVDVVVVATPDHWHHKIASEALKAGKAVYCEKPMCHTIDQAKDLVKVVKETGKKLQVGVQGTSLQRRRQDPRPHPEERNRQAGARPVEPDPEQFRRPVARLRRVRRRRQTRPRPRLGPVARLPVRPGPQARLARAALLPVPLLLGLLGRRGHRPLLPPARVSWSRRWAWGCPNRSSPPAGSTALARTRRPLKGFPDDRENPDLFNMFVDYPGGPTVTLARLAGQRRRP